MAVPEDGETDYDTIGGGLTGRRDIKEEQDAKCGECLKGNTQ